MPATAANSFESEGDNLKKGPSYVDSLSLWPIMRTYENLKVRLFLTLKVVRARLHMTVSPQRIAIRVQIDELSTQYNS